MDNIFEDIPNDVSQEICESIAGKKEVHIERIISQGQYTPVGEWLSQDKDEWVILLQGGAEIFFEGEDSNVVMNPGDYLFIERGRRHRVESTLKDKKTIWLAVHF